MKQNFNPLHSIVALCRTSLFLAIRYLKINFSFNSIPTMLSIFGPIIGIAVLITVQSVMNGFQDKIRKTFLNVNSHITIRSHDGIIKNPFDLIDRLEAMDFKASPTIEGVVFVQTMGMKKDIKQKVLLGVDPETISDVINIMNEERDLEEEQREKEEAKRNKAAGHPHALQRVYAVKDLKEIKDGHVILGLQQLTELGLQPGSRHIVEPGESMVSIAKRFAVDITDLETVNNLTTEFNLKVGQSIDIPGDKIGIHPAEGLKKYFEIDNDNQLSIVEPDDQYVPHELYVQGYYETGNSELNKNFIFVNLETARNLMEMDAFEQEVTSIKVMTKDPMNFDQHIRRIKGLPLTGPIDFAALDNSNNPFVGLEIRSWRDERPDFFDALKMEKTMIFLLLILIIVVAAFCVCSTLITIVFKKTSEIGIIKSMGGGPFTIMMIFCFQGFILGSIGCLIGTGLGYGMIAIRNKFLNFVNGLNSDGGNLLNENLYFFSELPAKTVVSEVVTVNVCAMIMCMLAGLLPALMANSVSPSKAVKVE